MPNYQVEVIATTTYKVDVEADSADEAVKAAENLEYADMIEVSDTTEFNVVSGDEDEEYDGIEVDEEEDEAEEK